MSILDRFPNAYMGSVRLVTPAETGCPVCGQEAVGIGSHSHGPALNPIAIGSGFYCAEGHVWCPGCWRGGPGGSEIMRLL